MSEIYAQNYYKRHGQIQVLGMSQSISFDDIYTNVKMMDAETVKILESIERLEKVYREAHQRYLWQQTEAKQKGIAVENTEQYLCVLGGPGIGKTTYLRKVGLAALLRNVESYDHEKIPVFLDLKRLRDPDLDLKKSIAEEFEICGFPKPEQFTDHALKSGDFLILLDGLDEVLSGSFNQVVQSIIDFSDRYSNNRFITSCRIAAYPTYFTGFKTVAIAELDDDQIFEFIKKWFDADPNPQLTREKKAEYVNTIWEQLKEPDFIYTKELPQTPLLLAFICLVCRQGKTIIDNQAKLYSKALDFSLKDWANSKLMDENWEIYQDFSADIKKDMLASIAYVGFEEDKLFFEKDELAEQITAFLTNNLNVSKHLDVNKLMEEIAVQSGILVKQATDIYSFSHLTLQEHLCAEYIRNWSYEDQLIQNHAADKHWRGVFLLVTELKGHSAIEFLQQLEEQTQALSEYPKLSGLLAWVESKTSTAISDFSGEIRRVFTLILIFDLTIALTLALALDLDLALALDVALARDRDRERFASSASVIASLRESERAKAIATIGDLASVRALASNLSSGLNLDVALDHALDDTLASDLALASAFARGNVLAMAQFALDKKLMVDVELQTLISCLKNSSHALKTSSKGLTSIVSSSLNISQELFDLSKDDLQMLTNYFSTCQLMIDCSKQASGLSVNDWNAIRQQMFLPPQF
ncbi:NACHT domain-containing protein [Acaryochloris marina]|uniref:NACHT domain-containing protein n=1 Tax=Acaryochloris marina TaxID=155978 RepID=UPI0002D4B526|nr:NACHT domain-containing protein [Acaryochloris marina]